MVDRTNIEALQNAEVFDSTGASLGRVKQLYVGQQTDEPTWVTVNTGLFGTKETFIPLAEARQEGDRITVPYEKAFVKDAPNIDEDGDISPEEEEELYRYYGVTDQGAAGAPAGQRGGEHRADRDRDRTATGAGVGAAGAGVGAAGAGYDRDGVRDGDRLEKDRAGRDELGLETAGRDGVRDGADLGRDRDHVDAEQGTTLHEERLNVGTERRETGRVRLRKYVVSDTERVEVPVEREEVVLERVPATEDGRGAELSEGEVEVPVHEEHAVVNKETVATEEVRLGKKTVQDTETVQADVAREEVEVDRDGGLRGKDGLRDGDGLRDDAARRDGDARR